MGIKSKAPEKVTLKIPKPLYDKIALLIEGAGYNSVTDFVVFVLRDLVGSSSLESNENIENGLEVVRTRLKSLGYL